MTKVSVSSDQSIVSVHVPIAFRRRRGRKLILVPADSLQPDWSPPPSKADPALVKALARAHRWKKLLDAGAYATIKEIAETEQVAARYIGQLLQLTLLAPDIIEMILDGRLPRGLGLNHFMDPWPGLWEEQRALLRAMTQE